MMLNRSRRAYADAMQERYSVHHRTAELASAIVRAVPPVPPTTLNVWSVVARAALDKCTRRPGD